MARIHKELYKKDLHDPDNHDGVITHLEPDILECKVKWALGNITTSKASGDDGIPAELFQILKDLIVLKCCTQYASKLGKLSRGHRTRREKAMATHSSTLAWKIPWMEEPGRLSPWGC